MRLSPRGVTLLAAVVAGVLTDLVAFVPSLHFAYHSVPLHAMLEMNGNPRGFAPAPHARTVSGLAAWDYAPDAGIKVFALCQANGWVL